MKIRAILIFILLAIEITGFSQTLQTVDTVDLNRYCGQWYEIASYPARFQKGCHCTTAEYEIVPGKDIIRITNRCIRFSKGRSRIAVAHAKAYPDKGSANAKLRVQFFWPFRGDYYIIGLAGDYSWAIIGHPERKYLWILSRDSFMPSQKYDDILNIVRERGYSTGMIEKTLQNCDIVE